MKKLFASILILSVCLFCLTSCNKYAENEWFSAQTLSECLVPELPGVEKSFISDGNNIYVSFSGVQLDNYARAVYDYLRSREFKYLGTRGDQKNSFKGLFTTYYFKQAEELDDFIVNGHYIFVYSDGTLDEYGDPIFCILAIRDYGKTTVKLNRKKTFTYTTEISLSYGSETPVGGKYALPDGKNPKHAFLNDYESWLSELALHSVSEIKITEESVGVPPGRLKDVKKTTDRVIIADLIDSCARATMTPITSEEAEIDGGSAFTIEFILTDGTVKKLSFNNGNYAYYGAAHNDPPLYFRLNSVPKLEIQENVTACYSFVTYVNTGTVYDGITPVCQIRVDELEFVELREKIGLPAENKYVVDTEFGKLFFKTEDIFYIDGSDGTYYRLIGELIKI